MIEQFAFYPPKESYPRDFVSCTGNKLQFVANVPILEYTVENSRYTILYSYSTCADLSLCDKGLFGLSRALGVNIVAYDYSGYGQNGILGKCSEKACYQDIETVYSYLVAKGIPSDHVILMGTSLGSGPCVHLASKYRVGGVILQCPIASMARIVPKIGGILAKIPHLDMFVNVNKIGKVSAPLYIVHGKKDALIPVKQCQSLVSKASNVWRSRYIDGAGHADLLEIGKNTINQDIQEFIAFLG